ncbi:flavin-containing monooxygenase [Candidatus Pelagadaptatus aseana]|uniref:flavin-containing monooxygenase n=1 Tax=Candidatus Pelagadaptatus aseana TaxID=3120508 RepID=UPI003C6FE4F2
MAQQLRNPKVVVIGAGMTGILMTIKLREAGINDVIILEKADKVGGTWRENTYPGVACDVPSYSYTYKFEPNPNWSHLFARGDEIQQYFQMVADKYGVTQSVRFNESVTDAVYDEGKWTVKTSKGDTIIADFVVAATGILHHPARPDIEGIDSFKGTMFHSAEWNHSIDMKGKRVGVIGNGSTAAQFIPELINGGAEVSVFQRTPQWILPLKDRKFSETHKKLMRKSPALQRAFNRFGIAFLEQFFTKAVTGEGKVQGMVMEKWVKRNLKKQVKDPELRKKLTPDYKVGCKRLIINNTFLDAIQKPNAHLVTDGIESITDKGIVTKDGVEHELDVIVLSTGFKPTAYMRPMNMVGRDGLHIDEAWKKKIKAYRSVNMENYPNFFLMLGPNTPIGNFSVIAMSEVQTDYILKLIGRWRQGEYDALEAKPEAIDEFMAYIKEGMANTAWTGGCQSWYLDGDGDPILWPYTWGQWVKEMQEPDMAAFNTQTFAAKKSAKKVARKPAKKQAAKKVTENKSSTKKDEVVA